MPPRLDGEASIAAFWAKVDRRGPDECWNWTGCIQKSGHGFIGRGGKPSYAHRFSFELHNGPLGAGVFVCHHCDNPRCVNPAHLFAGQSGDNVRDMFLKDLAGCTKLTVADVRAIRLTVGNSWDDAVEAGLKYGVHPSQIRKILRRKAWAMVTE